MTTNYIAPGYTIPEPAVFDDERERWTKRIVPAIRRSTPAVDEWIDEQLREQWDRELSDPGWDMT